MSDSHQPHSGQDDPRPDSAEDAPGPDQPPPYDAPTDSPFHAPRPPYEQPHEQPHEHPHEQGQQDDTRQYGQYDPYGPQPGQYGQYDQHDQHYGQYGGHTDQGWGQGGYPGWSAYPGHSGYGYPYGYGWTDPRQQRARTPGWLWPLVAGLALVVGLVGGAIGGALVADQGGDTPGGVLAVQRRTAPPLPADNRSIASVAAKVLPSTVQIVAEYHGDPQGATGSGWVFDKQGHVITNNHVVAEAAGDGGPIDVIDHAGRHHKATVVGRSPVYDIAVLRVHGEHDFTPLAIGSSDQMRVGETVVAFGSPLGLSSTVTSGIISAVDRPVTTGDNGDSSYINALQTDAAINPGNSGGPLVNLRGQVIGVNSAIASLGASGPGDESGNIGVGFAIPIEQVQVTTDQILRTGHAEYPVIGATVRGTRRSDGAVIEKIQPGEPAAATSLRPGDVITAVNGDKVKGSIDLVVAIRAHVPGETVTLTYRRDGTTHKVRVKLDAKTG